MRYLMASLLPLFTSITGYFWLCCPRAHLGVSGVVQVSDFSIKFLETILKKIKAHSQQTSAPATLCIHAVNVEPAPTPILTSYFCIIFNDLQSIRCRTRGKHYAVLCVSNNNKITLILK